LFYLSRALNGKGYLSLLPAHYDPLIFYCFSRDILTWRWLHLLLLSSTFSFPLAFGFVTCFFDSLFENIPEPGLDLMGSIYGVIGFDVLTYGAGLDVHFFVFLLGGMV
jgi:hypothetical protein